MRAILVFTVFLTLMFGSAHAHGGHHGDTMPPWQKATGWPDRIVVTLADQPQSRFSVTWRTDETVTETIAQIAIATDDARFDLDAITVSARTEPLNPAMPELAGTVYAEPMNAGLPAAHFHSVTFSNWSQIRCTLIACAVSMVPGVNGSKRGQPPLLDLSSSSMSATLRMGSCRIGLA